MGLKHYRTRPNWTCAHCGDLWPCLPARVLLLAEFAGRRVELRMVLGAHYADARVDLAETEINGREHYEQLYKRFFAWTGR